jgi:hypothetical protein
MVPARLGRKERRCRPNYRFLICVIFPYEQFMNPLFELSTIACPLIVGIRKVLDKRGFKEIKDMWTHEVPPERLAELFHHYHQALTREVSGKRGEERGSWSEVPPQEKNRLVAAARLALLELESTTSHRAKSRQYFAQPGEAEWGC